mgnify:CR=1 FL=1
MVEYEGDLISKWKYLKFVVEIRPAEKKRGLDFQA